uniref:Uncharacterized protein n=1 Tax=Setaria viridis TaxID=4556 RepID=A0A4U6TNS1_SETVI|nr:hypothetical protein SEVIR_7G100200v2 [Setaria viridis]
MHTSAGHDDVQLLTVTRKKKSVTERCCTLMTCPVHLTVDRSSTTFYCSNSFAGVKKGTGLALVRPPVRPAGVDHRSATAARQVSTTAALAAEQHRSTSASRRALFSFLPFFRLTNSWYRLLASSGSPSPPLLGASIAAASSRSAPSPPTAAPSASSAARLTSATRPSSAQATVASNLHPPSTTAKRTSVSPVYQCRPTDTGRRLETFTARPRDGSTITQLSSSSSGDGDAAEAASVAAGLFRSTASTRNGEPRNHGDDAGVSTTRERRGAPLWYTSTAETSSPGSPSPSLTPGAASGDGNGKASAKSRRGGSAVRRQRPWLPPGSASDGHSARQSARHVSVSAASARSPAVAQLAAASERPSRRRSAQPSTSACRSSIVVVTILIPVLPVALLLGVNSVGL